MGSFSLLVLLASTIESCTFLFAHNPLVLECLGVVTIIIAMLSLAQPGGSNAKSAGGTLYSEDVITKMEATEGTFEETNSHDN